MSYRSAFIGCGLRSKNHLKAYEHVKSIEVAALADLDEEKLNERGDAFGIKARYTDMVQMLKEVKPDIVHCVTQPNFRVQPVRTCAEHGVKAIIIEKPMAETLSAAEEIEKIAADTGIKVIVNTQRRYFESWQRVVELANSEQAGRIRKIRINCSPSVNCTGSHHIDQVQSLLGDPDPKTVLATAYGAEDWYTNHPGPANMFASIVYPNRVSLHAEFSRDGVNVPGCPGFWMSAGIDVVTDNGMIRWTECNGTTYQFAGMAQPEKFQSDFKLDDPKGQGAFTEAIGTWLDDPNTPHGNRLETAIRVFRIVCTMVQSAARNGRMKYDAASLDDCYDELRQKLVAIEGDNEDWDWGTCPDQDEAPAGS